MFTCPAVPGSVLGHGCEWGGWGLSSRSFPLSEVEGAGRKQENENILKIIHCDAHWGRHGRAAAAGSGGGPIPTLTGCFRRGSSITVNIRCLTILGKWFCDWAMEASWWLCRPEIQDSPGNFEFGYPEVVEIQHRAQKVWTRDNQLPEINRNLICCWFLVWTGLYSFWLKVVHWFLAERVRLKELAWYLDFF